jgi:hypothetical protein
MMAPLTVAEQCLWCGHVFCVGDSRRNVKIIVAKQWGGKTADSWIRLVLKRSRDWLLVLAVTLACVEIELQVTAARCGGASSRCPSRRRG